MRAGIASLIAAYVLSQFYRACLAVLAPVLNAEIGVSSETLANASGLWFLTFAVMQLPVGWALDRIGPRRTTAVLLALGGGGGALVFAAATNPSMILIAMALIGVGCAPVLMASYTIFARSLPPAAFPMLAGLVVGVGLMGNLASATPLAWAVGGFGWRQTMAGLAGVTFAAAALVATLVRDPPAAAPGQAGSVWSLLQSRALWPILAMMAVCYMPVAALRGFWVGPYHADVFGADTIAVGRAALVMGLAMVAGTFAYGPAERLLGTRKWLILGGNVLTALCIGGLWLWPTAGGWTTQGLLAGAGFFGASFPMVIAHGRAFIPAHLTGRGVTLLNLFGIAPVGIAQVLTGRLHGRVAPVPVEAPYVAVFGAIALVTLAGCAVYAFSQDRTG